MWDTAKRPDRNHTVQLKGPDFSAAITKGMNMVAIHNLNMDTQSYLAAASRDVQRGYPSVDV